MDLRTNFKIIIIGSEGKGKTSLINKYTKNIFSDTYKATITCEKVSKIFENNLKTYNIEIWEIPNYYKNPLLNNIFVYNSHGCVILSDRSEVENDLRLKKTLDEEVKFLDRGKIPCILVESKCDLIEENQREKFKQELNEFAEKNGFDGGFLVSSKTGENVVESMDFLIKEIIKRIDYMASKGIEDYIFERKSFPLDPEKLNNIEKTESKKTESKKSEPKKNVHESGTIDYYDIYNIDEIKFYDLEEGLIEMCIYRDYDKTGYKCKVSLSKLKEKYEFLDWVTDVKKFVEVLENLNEKKKIKINLCLDKILISISIIYTKYYGETEEMKFILRYNDVEEKDILETILLEIIKMKENKKKSEEKSESSEGEKKEEEE